MKAIRPRSRRFDSDRGQSLVEIALMIPVLLLIVVGIIDIGRVFAYRVATTGAAREAAMLAALDPQAVRDTVCQRARVELGVAAIADPCGAAPVTVLCTRDGVSCSTNDSPTLLYQTPGGGAVSVTVTYRVQLLTTYLLSRAFSANPVEISATASFGGLSE